MARLRRRVAARGDRLAQGPRSPGVDAARAARRAPRVRARALPARPDVRPFVAWCRAGGVAVSLVSDGFGFYIRPLLEAHGIDAVGIRTNGWRDGARMPLTFDHAHPGCIGCGTCKKLAVEEARASRGSVAFVGEGPNDRFGARYADVTFAKEGESLVRRCEIEGIPYVAWTSFDDVRNWLQSRTPLPGPLGGEPCPGWQLRT